jgi:hypothetical protein
MVAIVTAASTIVLSAACAALACGDPGRGPTPDDPSNAPASVSQGTEAAALDELAARAILGDGLRQAGFRIRADIAHPAGDAIVVLDGWDADRAVGFEYLATAAGDPPLDPAARAALGERVLVVGPSDEAALRAALVAFVARIGAGAAQP